MAKLIQSPNSLNEIVGKSIFLAGTIDDGNSVDWQQTVISELQGFEVTILNPRRTEWDASWVQSIGNANFKEQVEWELSALDLADIIFIYFAPGSYSPISLLEFGLHARAGKLTVVCPEGFWKKGNIDVVAQRFGMNVFETIGDGVSSLQSRLT